MRTTLVILSSDITSNLLLRSTLFSALKQNCQLVAMIRTDTDPEWTSCILNMINICQHKNSYDSIIDVDICNSSAPWAITEQTRRYFIVDLHVNIMFISIDLLYVISGLPPSDRFFLPLLGSQTKPRASNCALRDLDVLVLVR